MKYGKVFKAMFAKFPELNNKLSANKVSLLPRKELILVAKTLYHGSAAAKAALAKYPTMTTKVLAQKVWAVLKSI